MHLTDRVAQYANGSLFISSTSAKDNGKYTCSAENGIGKNAEKTITVDIKGNFLCWMSSVSLLALFLACLLVCLLAFL